VKQLGVCSLNEVNTQPAKGNQQESDRNAGGRKKLHRLNVKTNPDLPKGSVAFKPANRSAGKNALYVE
jgi:hypothetical protein